MKHKNATNILFTLAIATAFLVRFWKLSELPFPPDGDELAFGYYGWSLLHFATDEYGNFLPANFLSIGDYKYPGLPYLNILPAMIFGLSGMTIRFWSALSGVVLVFLVYLFSRSLFKNRSVALASAWFAALSPWSIIESRLGWENHLSMVITLSGFIILLDLISVKNKKRRNLLSLFAILLFVLSTFIYAAQRLFIPLMLCVFFMITFIKKSGFKKIRKNVFVSLTAVSVIVTASLISPHNRGRASEEAWKGLSPEQLNRLQELYVQAGTSQIRIPPRMTWFFNNKYTFSAIDFLERYTDHFSPKFLFFFGESSNQKIPDMGMLLWIELLTLPAGLLVLFGSKYKVKKSVLFFWLLLAPVASALTQGGAHINRASLMIPPLSILSGLGTVELLSITPGKLKKITLFILIVGFLYSSLYALNQIFIQKPLDKPWVKEQVYKDVTLEILRLKDKYKAVVTGDDDYIYFLFYGRISPSEFVKNSDINNIEKGNWERVDRLYNIHFKMPFNCPKSGKKGVLYVCSGHEIPQNSKIVKIFYYKDKVPAFSLIEYYPLSLMPGKLPEPPDKFHYLVETENPSIFPDGIIPDSHPSYW